MTEKRQLSYDLETFKAAFDRLEKLAVTGEALRSAAAFGFGCIEIVRTIQTMQRKHFYKSMTSYVNNQMWQDVYHVPTSVGVL
jgi:motility quorum-sensing regulator/GCU-specific mRNA interferase toxin